MKTVTTSVDLLREVHATLRRCGGGQRECASYLAGPIDRPGVLDVALHPRHAASAGGYEIDERWIDETWLALAAEGREIRMQIHTHPGPAYHSRTDDAYPLVRTPGFLSLVVPDFATRSDLLAGAFLARLDDAGAWQRVDVNDVVVVA